MTETEYVEVIPVWILEGIRKHLATGEFTPEQFIKRFDEIVLGKDIRCRADQNDLQHLLRDGNWYKLNGVQSNK